MEAVLTGLDLLDFKEQAMEIEKTWSALLKACVVKPAAAIDGIEPCSLPIKEDSFKTYEKHYAVFAAEFPLLPTDQETAMNFPERFNGKSRRKTKRNRLQNYSEA